uniref:C2H2-type domain-containing protein n=1 Tax=Heliothis virescens TaxID=7102 RepID=A0A2A4KAK0_HELVI
MSSGLEHEDLENVALVRMEDVQPSRDRIDRTVDLQSPPSDDEEIYETCIIDKVDYDNECAIDDDSDSNIGSMVSIQSEEMVEEEEECSDTEELIVPEALDPSIEIMNEPIQRGEEVKIHVKPNQSDSWPTLEILPGGVIKNAVDCEAFPSKTAEKAPRKGEMMYACAKCPQVFKYLFCLVKHVKWHEEQAKLVDRTPNLTPLEKELVLIKRERNELDKTYKMQKVEVFARIAAAIGKINNTRDIFK